MNPIKYSPEGRLFSPYSFISFFKYVFASCILLGFSFSLKAQEPEFIRSSWWLGVAGGTNFNLYHGGSPSRLNPDVTTTGGFQSGNGTGLFAFPVLEYHSEDKAWGFILQGGYESREGTFDNALTTKLAYVTIEPSMRLNLFRTPFYLFSGPRVGINVDKRFTYLQEGGVLSNMEKFVFSFQVGAGVDIPFTPKKSDSQVILAPFFAFQPYFGQSPRTTDSWNITTLRAGIALKFGRSHRLAESKQISVPVSILGESSGGLVINEPPAVGGIKADETIPIGDQVQFDIRPSEITSQNVRLTSQQLKNIKKEMQGFDENENFSDSVLRQITANDNFLSILGKQMVKDQSSTVTLIGSSRYSALYGRQLANSMKIFLSGAYGIEPTRIKTQGRKRLKTHIGKQKDRNDLALLFEKDRQVLIRSNSESLKQEFRGTPGSSVKPLEMKVVHEPDAGGYFIFNARMQQDNFTSWSLKITDSGGKIQNFGPYSGETARIPNRKILGENTVGEYRITMLGQLNSGQIVQKDTTVYLRIWPRNSGKNYKRFSISYEFNNLQSISDFRRYLVGVVVPEVPADAKVVIYGHSNPVNDRYFDLKKYLLEVNDARDVMLDALVKSGQTKVQFEVYGLGDDQIIDPFKEMGPEEKRSYNRTLIIDVVPQKKRFKN